MNLNEQMKRVEKAVADAKRALAALNALATKAANRGQKPYYRKGKPVRGHGEQDGASDNKGKGSAAGDSKPLGLHEVRDGRKVKEVGGW